MKIIEYTPNLSNNRFVPSNLVNYDDNEMK